MRKLFNKTEQKRKQKEKEIDAIMNTIFLHRNTNEKEIGRVYLLASLKIS